MAQKLPKEENLAAAVELYDVYRRLGRNSVLDGLTLLLEEGELYGLIGPNGAGKTTTLRVVLGLLEVDHGTVYLLGQSPQSAGSGRLRRVGALVDGLSPSTRLSGREYLGILARWARVRVGDIEQVVELLGLGRMLERPVATYSTGMRQLLAIAGALLGPPELLVLDEPTAGLDPRLRRRVNDLLAAHVHDGGTVLLASHQLDEAERLCTRVGLLSEGRLVSEGPPDRLGSAAGRFELIVADPGAALLTLRRARLVCWHDDGKILIEPGPPGPGQPDGSDIAQVLARSGIFPLELRRAPTLELAYAELTGAGGR